MILAALNESGQGQDSVQMIDSTIVRAHQHAAGAQKASGPEGEGLGRSRGGFSTKIHLRANGLGLPGTVVLTGGETNDVKGYEPLPVRRWACTPRITLLTPTLSRFAA